MTPSDAHRHPTVDEARQKVALSPDVARHLIEPPIGRNQFYGMLSRGEIPSIRLGQDQQDSRGRAHGGRILVPTAPFLALFGLASVESPRNAAENEAESAHPITGADVTPIRPGATRVAG